MLQPRSLRSITACLVMLALLAAADLWAKAWAERTLSRAQTGQTLAPCTADAEGHYFMHRPRADAIVLVEGYLELRYAENCGAAFSLLDQSPRWLRAGVFTVAGTLAVVALMWMFVRGSGGVLFACSVPLVVSGAIGNMIDRLRLGYVVDFIHFHVRDGFDWPTFNVADSTITVGVALLLLDGLRRPAPEPKAAAREAGPEEA